MYPIDKYKFYKNGKTVYAVSTYAGKTVRGKATCHDNDEFSIDKGATLAALRCGTKIALRRRARAMKKLQEAHEAVMAANRHCAEMQRYYDDATMAFAEIESELYNFEKSL